MMDWQYLGAVVGHAFSSTPSDNIDLSLSCCILNNGEIVYQVRYDNSSYHVSRNPSFGTKELSAKFSHMIRLGNKTYYFNI